MPVLNTREYAVTASLATITTAKTLIQVKAGSATPLWISYIAVDGSSDTADGMDITIVRKSAAATVTSFTPLLLNATAGTGQVAQAAGGTSATGTNASAEGTDGDILWRRQASVQSGGGVAERFADGEILVAAGGIIGLKSNITITSATLTATLYFVEIG